jgi:hypothetical protein
LAVAANNLLFVVKPDPSSEVAILKGDHTLKETFAYPEVIYQPRYIKDKLYFISIEGRARQVWTKSNGIRKLTQYSSDESVNDYVINGDVLYVGTNKGIDKWENGFRSTLYEGLEVKSLLMAENGEFVAIAGSSDKFDLVKIHSGSTEVLVKGVLSASVDINGHAIYYTKLRKKGIYRYLDGRVTLVNDSIGEFFQRVQFVFEGNIWIKDTNTNEFYVLKNGTWTAQTVDLVTLENALTSWDDGYITRVVNEKSSRIVKGEFEKNK